METMAASSFEVKGLQWLLQTTESQSLDLQEVFFYLSHPNGSGCYFEKEKSLVIRISRDCLPSFAQILSGFCASRNAVSSLSHLQFHRVEWSVELLQNLGVLLRHHCCVKKLVLIRNTFDGASLFEFCQVLRSDGGIKELTFSECELGSSGAVLVAEALKLNSSVEELQIWEDSIGVKGAEELAQMIEANSTLKLLTIYDSLYLTATPLISAVVARNRAMEVHIWSGKNGDKVSKVVEFVPENRTLKIYRLDISGSCRVACSLGLNTTVKSLDLTGVQLKSKFCQEFRWVLEQNQCLKEVKFTRAFLRNKGIFYIAAGLFKNRTLESLYIEGNRFNGVGVEYLLCPLSRFSSLQFQANITLKSLTFGGEETKIGRTGLAAILQMLSTNETLTKLGIVDDQYLKPVDFFKIFKCIEKNASLRSLNFQGCKGVQGEKIFNSIMELLQVNPWIESFDLSRTPLHNSGQADEVYRRLGKSEQDEAELDDSDIDLFKDLPMMEPKSCRVFLCGQQYAGKSTLSNTICQNFSRFPYMEQVRSLVKPIEHTIKASGMRVQTLKDGDRNLNMWNLGGQHEMCSIHDIMFPGHGSASCFLIISSLYNKQNSRDPKAPSEVEEDIQYWLRFIVSTSKRAELQNLLPNVTVVLTHQDKINHPSECLQHSVNLVYRMLEKFQGFVDFYPTVFAIDARSSESVSNLTQHIRKTCKTILERVPRVYQFCNDMNHFFSNWRNENDNRPVIKWKEFGELCQLKVPQLRVRSRRDNKKATEMRRKSTALCLHQMGEVIYFDELRFIVLDSDWFCCEVLGNLSKLAVGRLNSEDRGFVSRQQLEKILRRTLENQIPGVGTKVFEVLDTSDLYSIMLKLELCYKQHPSDEDSLLLVPSMLEESRSKTQRWQFGTSDSIYTGRHFECDNSSHTSLMPGFFPRLQVNLHNKMMSLRDQHGATYSFEKYLIIININGISIRVELGGQLGYHIDILGCSTNNLTETLRLIQQLIVPAVQSLCSNVTLVESVMRPECVKNLTPPRYRKTQHVALQKLKQSLLSLPADNMYDYQYTWELVSDCGKTILYAGFDLARDLLSDDDFREVLNSRYNDLHNLAMELDVPLESNDRSDQAGNSLSRVDPSFAGIAHGVEQVLQRLKIIEQEIRDLKQEIQGLRYYEHSLLVELTRKVNYLVNFNVQVEERKVPNMFFFVRTENYSRRLITSVLPGMNALRLHLLCEYRREMHVVEDQMGCEMMQVDSVTARRLTPYLKKFMTLLTFALKIGAHMAAGMGQMIPDLTREIAHLSGSSLIYGAGGAVAVGAVGAAALAYHERSRDVQQDLQAAQQWLLDFLRERGCSSGKDIGEVFGLWRVRYRDDGQIAWICKRHFTIRSNEVFEVPL